MKPTCVHPDKSHKHNVDGRKQVADNYIQHSVILIKLENKQMNNNLFPPTDLCEAHLFLKRKKWVIKYLVYWPPLVGGGGASDHKGKYYKGSFMGDGNICGFYAV